MIKFAVMTFMYNGWVNSENGSHEELIRIIGDSGAEGIEAFANHFMSDDKLVNLYQREMPCNGVTMPVMDLLANLADPDKKGRNEAYDLMRKGIDICDALNSEIVHVAGCSLVEGVTSEEGRKWIAEGLSDFVDDVEKRGMVLAFENFNPSPELICSAEDCLEILSLTDPRVKFVFDTGNFAAAEEHPEDNFKKFGDKICHFHFKDFTGEVGIGKHGGTYFGEGFINNNTIVEFIKKSNYSGWVALESYLQNENGPCETIPKEMEVIKSLFQS